MRRSIAVLVGVIWAGVSGSISYAENEPLVKGVQDNACLVEEAYNQEPGVVQHVACLQRQGRNWSLEFEQEWPLGSETHQFSYSIPYLWLRNEHGRTQGIGDIKLNYRYQAIFETDSLPAFAPRFSAILPTGDRNKELGNRSLGYEILLPFSKVVSDRVALHFNAGSSHISTSSGTNRRTIVSAAASSMRSHVTLT